MKKHLQDIEEIRQQLLMQRKEQRSFSLQSAQHHSNTIRDNGYRKKSARLDIGKLNRVLHVDVEKRVAVVEPRVTMEQLVDAILPYGMIPPVIPEFKGITVGGAIMGTALESSSHLHGQFNDCCITYEVLLGDGTIIRVTREEHPDLFYGISGSYGTLGIILSAEISLIPASAWISLSYSTVSTPDDAVKTLSLLHRQDDSPDFLEALVFGLDQTVVVSGRFLPPGKPLPDKPRCSLDRSWSPWYYQHVKEKGQKALQNGPQEELMPLRDYLFRHDRAVFWIGAYALHPSMLFRYALDLFGICPAWFRKWQAERDPQQYGRLKYPGRIFRSLFGWMMNSQRLYSFLHSGTEKWFADRFVIQDFYIPEAKTAAFTDEVLKKYSIVPLWLCPIKSTQTPQHLSPHCYKGESDLLFDVGVYGFPQGKKAACEVTQDLEYLTTSCGGRKMLYGYSYYTKEQFWTIYPEGDYLSLRKKYQADGAWLKITDKVLLD